MVTQVISGCAIDENTASSTAALAFAGEAEVFTGNRHATQAEGFAGGDGTGQQEATGKDRQDTSQTGAAGHADDSAEAVSGRGRVEVEAEVEMEQTETSLGLLNLSLAL